MYTVGELCYLQSFNTIIATKHGCTSELWRVPESQLPLRYFLVYYNLWNIKESGSIDVNQ